MEEAQRRDQETRGDNIEIPDSTRDNEPQLHNPYYTDEEEPYEPPDASQYGRRMSDSSSDANMEDGHGQREGNMTEEMMRTVHEDLNYMSNQENEYRVDNPINEPDNSGIYFGRVFFNIKITTKLDAASNGSDKTITHTTSSSITNQCKAFLNCNTSENVKQALYDYNGKQNA